MKTSIHINPIKPSSETHNLRIKNLDYVMQNLSKNNESFSLSSVTEKLEKIKIAYQKTTRQKMQAKASPIREGVVVIKENTTMEELKNFAKVIENRFGIKTFQAHIHRDEGHKNEENELKINHHAHLLFDWTSSNGKSLKLNRENMSEMQTLLAQSLNMERGQSSEKKHLNAIQFKTKKEEEKFENYASAQLFFEQQKSAKIDAIHIYPKIMGVKIDSEKRQELIQTGFLALKDCKDENDKRYNHVQLSIDDRNNKLEITIMDGLQFKVDKSRFSPEEESALREGKKLEKTVKKGLIYTVDALAVYSPYEKKVIFLEKSKIQNMYKNCIIASYEETKKKVEELAVKNMKDFHFSFNIPSQEQDKKEQKGIKMRF